MPAAESDRIIEYIHKKATYIFPAEAEIFAVGDKISVELKGKRVRDISIHACEKLAVSSTYDYRYGLPVTGIGTNLYQEYENILGYFEKKKKISFLQFDHATSHEVALCTFFRPLDFIKTGNLVQETYKSLPFLINIFTRPLIHLRQAEIIQPIDAVKRVNHNTVRYLTRHAETWKDIDYKADQIVPAKLLTRVYEDDYSIYENVVFRDLIDTILTFLRKRIFYLTEILETFKESIQLDAVNRFNHQKYYLAIGKLYVGFYKMENSAEIQSALDSIKQLYKQISKYKVRAVYTKNANAKAVVGEVKRTNILTMHKDYKHVFSLYQKFKKNVADSTERGSTEGQRKSQNAYEKFCAMLIVFSASNFNFSCKSEETIFKNGMVDAVFTYGNWKMRVKSEHNDVLGFNVIAMTILHGTTIVKYLVIPMTFYLNSDKKKQYENIVERLYRTKKSFDKYIFFEPFDMDDNPLYNYSLKCSAGKVKLNYAVLPVSVTEINSFRRVQKILFEGLVLSNRTFDACAFCGEPLTKETGKSYLCKKCKTGIKKIDCKQCGKEYTATYVAIKNRKSNKAQSEDESLKGMPEFFVQEKKHLFRNIVNMNKNNYVCPHCGSDSGSKSKV